MDHLGILENDINALTESALSIAATKTDDKVSMANHAIELLQNASGMAQHIVSNIKSEHPVVHDVLSLLDKAFYAAKEIVSVVDAASPQEIAAVTVNLADTANQLVQQILEMSDQKNEIAQALQKTLGDSFADIKTTAQNIASAAAVDDKGAIAKASFDLLGEVGDIVAKTLVEGGVDVNPGQVAAIQNITHSVLGTAQVITDLATAPQPEAVTALSVSLVSHVNDVVADALLLGQQNAKIVQSTHDAIHKGLDAIGEAAGHLADADATTQAGKAGIAMNALTLIAQSNTVVSEIIQGAGLQRPETVFAHRVLDTLLNSAKNVASLIVSDVSTEAGRQQIAASSVQLIAQADDLLDSIQSVTASGNKISDALHAVLKAHIGNIESIAVQLAADHGNDAAGKTVLAKESFKLIAEANQMVGAFLEKTDLADDVSKSAGQLADSVLNTANVLTDLIQADPTTADGKLAIANHSFTLAKTANDMVANIMDLSGSSSESSHHISSMVGKSLGIAQEKLISIAGDVIELIDVNALTPEGTRLIVDKSLAITGTLNDALSEIMTVVGGDNIDQTGSNAIQGILDIGRSIAGLIQVDAGTPNGQATIAENSIKLAGNVNQLVNEVLKAADLSTQVTDVVTSSVSGVLGNLSDLVGSAIRLQNWSSMSHADQVAAGFDIGLKSVGAVANSISIVGESVSKILGTVTALPQIGAALSGLALAASPIEIKQLVDEHQHVKDTDQLGKESKLFGYEGDAVLADLLHEKFALNTAYTATNIALNVATTAISTAAAATVVGAPVAAIAGIVRGVVGGILTAVKQPSLELIANRYAEHIKEYGDVSAYFSLNTEATLEKIYQNSDTQDLFQKLQDIYDVDHVIALDGVASSGSAVELAALTKLSDGMNKANNYASLIRDGNLDKEGTAEQLQFDAKTGILNILSAEDTVIKFNSPMFAPGDEEAIRTKEGKNSYYTDLIINGPDHHTINDGAGNNVFISNDRYASVLFDSEGKVIKNIHLNINAGDGNDTYIADSGVTCFDGGNGIDSISYTNDKIQGIVVRGKDAGNYIVSKYIQDAEVVSESLKTNDISYGKRSEKVTYRDLNIETKSFENSDILHNVEIISASDHDDYLYGSQGSDYFLGQKGNDSIYGHAGNDVIDGGEGNDRIEGGDGDDQLTGGAGSDIINGDAGNDVIIQKDALFADTIDGGAGSDTLDLSGLVTSAEGKGVNLDLRTGVLDKGGIYDTVSNIEHVVGTAGDDVIHGNQADNILITGQGSDILYGESGDDVLYATAGDNTLYGGAGDDIYMLSIEGNHHIIDTQGKNIAKLMSHTESLHIDFHRDDAGTVSLDLSHAGSNDVGHITIDHADQFGFFSLAENCYLDLNDGSMKYILSGDKAEADLAQHSLNINQGETLNLYAAAKDNTVALDDQHQNIINIYENTHTDIHGFQLGKDKLKLLLGESLSQENSGLHFSGYDVDGGDVHLQWNDTELTLYGAGSAEYVGKDTMELTAVYLI